MENRTHIRNRDVKESVCLCVCICVCAHLRRKLTGQPTDVPSKLSEALIVTVYHTKTPLNGIRTLQNVARTRLSTNNSNTEQDR